MADAPSPTRKDPPLTRVGFLLVPGFALMSYAAAVEPLRAANHLSGGELYRWWHAAPGGRPVHASNGLAIIPDAEPSGTAPVDLVFVCAGGNPATFDDRPTLAWLRRLAASGVTIGGISGGPYVLARAGLLDGRRATLHWEHVPSFREAFPDVEVVPSLFELDGNRITCSGGISALDMMVALIARDHGHELAAAVGDWFLHTHIREGMGPQRMDLRLRLGVSDESLLKALRAMEANLEAPLARTELARLAGLSLRQLERLFVRDLGRGIQEHYRALRLDRARQLLRETTLSVLEVAVATGFASASQFSRAYGRAFAEAPSRTRRRTLGRPG
jgi:transcriptional regulator GlxA family with amidase domain